MADDERLDVIATMHRYAEALDRRDWALLEQVFTTGVTADYGGEVQVAGRDEMVGMIRSFLGGCGQTQHLLGNEDATVDGDVAHSSCKMRAHHVGVGDAAGKSYEIFGWYHTRQVRTPDGWRIEHIVEETSLELGTRDVLGPG